MPISVMASSAATTPSSSAARLALDCFAEPVIGPRFAPIRWLAITLIVAAALIVTGSISPALAASPAELISQFRAQHGETKVSSDATLNKIAQEQAAAMAAKETLDHDVAGAFTKRVARAKAGRAAENIAYGHADFPNTLQQWINSSGHRRNLLLKAASKVGVAHVRSAGGRTYWAMVIAGDYDKPKPKPKAVASNTGAKAGAAAGRKPDKPKPRDCSIRMLGLCI